MTLSGLVLRLVKGSPLTAQEGDNNLRKIRDFCNALAQLFGVVLKSDGTLKDGAVGSSAVLADGVVTAAKLAADAKTPAGVMVQFAGTAVPAGWLHCNGAAVSRTDYAALFAAIGTTWGVGDGSVTFNVPNMSRRVAVGSGGTGSADLGNTVGNTGGEEKHLLTGQESGIQKHRHGAWEGAVKWVFGGGITGSPGSYANVDPNNVNLETEDKDNTDAVQAHNCYPPSAVVLFIIKT